jgi:hypothetical protein
MTDNYPSTTTKIERMPCKLVSKDDPEKMGRIKVRFMDQSEKEIPDDKLQWSMPEGQSSGAGAANFQLGHYFVGQWLEASRMGDHGLTTRLHTIISSPGKSSGGGGG